MNTIITICCRLIGWCTPLVHPWKLASLFCLVRIVPWLSVVVLCNGSVFDGVLCFNFTVPPFHGGVIVGPPAPTIIKVIYAKIQKE